MSAGLVASGFICFFLGIAGLLVHVDAEDEWVASEALAFFAFMWCGALASFLLALAVEVLT